jgi:16S rRNA G966 N2-methylase RsmD
MEELSDNIVVQSKDIKLVPIEQIIPNPKNANRHSIEQIQRLEKLIKYQGMRNPLIVSNRTGFLIVGHGRLEACTNLEMKEVPVIYQDFENEAQEYSYLVSDNEIARWAELDKHAVYTELENLELDDIELLGLEDFTLPDVEELDPQTDEDEVPEVVEPITKRGDIWLLGRHRLMCGDSTMIDDVEKLIDNEIIDFVHTDPPYGINEKGDRTGRKTGLAANHNLKDFKDDTTQYAVDAFTLCDALDIKIQVWWGANYYCHTLPQQNNWLVWDKRIEDQNEDFNSDCELAWVKSGKNSVRIFRHLWKGMIKASEHGQARVHPTQKPVELIKHCFDRYDPDKKCNTVLDLFGGSGSTLIASEEVKKEAFLMELSEHYCDVIINRYQNYTGKKATLESTGQTYEELCSERK